MCLSLRSGKKTIKPATPAVIQHLHELPWDSKQPITQWVKRYKLCKIGNKIVGPILSEGLYYPMQSGEYKVGEIQIAKGDKRQKEDYGWHVFIEEKDARRYARAHGWKFLPCWVRDFRASGFWNGCKSETYSELLIDPKDAAKLIR